MYAATPSTSAGVVAESDRRRHHGICRVCSRSRWSVAQVCRRRDCPGYAPIWAGDQRRKLYENLIAYGEGTVRMGALTAPGQAVLPWDREHCASLGSHKCSGALGCRVDRGAAAAWNEAAPEMWRRLNRRVSQQVKREHGRAAWLLVRVWELQHRGVLHVHPVLAYGSYAERVTADRYFDLVDELAPQYGFGFSDRKESAKPARAAAAYLSAYFVTGKKEKAQLHVSVMSNAMPRSIIHVSTRLTQRTGCTMRELRFRRFVWRLADRAGCSPTEARTIALLAKAGTLDLSVDAFTPSPRMLAQILGRTPPPPVAGRDGSAPLNRPAPANA
jgi:hypothetical protein